jgi:citrate synthase
MSEAKSGITDGYYPDKILIRGYKIEDLIEHKSFPDVAFLTIFGKLPSKEESILFNAMLVAAVDHGFAPSTLTSRTVIGAAPEAFQGAIAAGILCIGDLHGGAIENSAKMLQEGVKRAKKEGKSMNEIAQSIVHEHWTEGKIIHGIGHPYHKVDPRADSLFKLAEKVGYKKEHVELIQAIEACSQREYGKKLPINIDGTVAALISDMGIDYRLGKAFFIMSRVVGLVAHTYEEMKRPAMGPVRDAARRIAYDGPPERALE